MEMLALVQIADPKSRPRLPAPVVGRDAAARDDRHGARVKPEAADRGRADHRAGRHDPGPDPRALIELQRRRHGDPADNPRPGSRRRDAHRVVVMYAGKVVERRPSRAVPRPRHPYTQGLWLVPSHRHRGRRERLRPSPVRSPSLPAPAWLPIRARCPHVMRCLQRGRAAAARASTRRTKPPVC